MKRFKGELTYGGRWVVFHDYTVEVYDRDDEGSMALSKEDLLAMLAALEDFEKESFDEYPTSI